MIDPRGLTAVEWTDVMALPLTSYVQPPRIDSDAEWQTWALLVVLAPRIAAFVPPNPLEFTDWREWAERFNQTVVIPT